MCERVKTNPRKSVVVKKKENSDDLVQKRNKENADEKVESIRESEVAVKKKENSDDLVQKRNKKNADEKAEPIRKTEKPSNKMPASSDQDVVVIGMFKEDETLNVLLYRLQEERFLTIAYADARDIYPQALIQYYERKLYNESLPIEIEWKD